MKRFLTLLAAAVIALSSLSACKGKGPSADEGRLKIVSTIFPPYDFARQIGKDRADAAMLLKPGMESHHYEPTPQDIRKIQDASLFIYTGGENDTWVDGILKSLGDKKPAVLKLTEIVSPAVHSSEKAGSHDGHSHESHAGSSDEHVWTAPLKAAEIANRIAGAMKEKDPANASFYEANRAEYVRQLEAMDAEFRSIVSAGRRKTLLFGDRFPLKHFAEAYGLKYYAAFSGCAAETEASAAALAFLIERAREEKIPAVFSLELSSGKIAAAVSEATGAKKMTFFTYHNITRAQAESGETFISMMKKNAESLKAALN